MLIHLKLLLNVTDEKEYHDNFELLHNKNVSGFGPTLTDFKYLSKYFQCDYADNNKNGDCPFLL